MADAQNTLRETIEANFDAAEASQNVDVSPVIEQTPAPESTQASTEQTADKVSADASRDEKGRFAKQGEQTQQVEQTKPQEAAPQAIEPVALDPATPRPTTWKKEYMPAWEKMAKGEALTPDESKKLAQYNVQREREFATGVSTYRAEAQNAKHLTEALAPFMPTIQRQGMSQAAFVQQLGSTYHFLVNGQPQEKLNAFAKLAQDVGIPLDAIMQNQGGNLDPVVPQLMQYIQTLESKVNNVSSWQNQQEQTAVQNEVAKFYDQTKYPHFEAVRATMGQLLQAGLVPDADTAYQKAVRMNDDAWSAEQSRLAQTTQQPQQFTQQVDKVAEAAQARARATSIKSSAPVGATKQMNSKDLRSILEAQFDAHTGTGRV